MSRTPIVRMNQVQVGDHIILASGLGFMVTDVRFGFTGHTDSNTNPDQERQLSYLLGLKRFDKNSQETQFTKIAVTPDGYYRASQEPCLNDVVRVSDPSRQTKLTPAGAYALKNQLDLKAALSVPNSFVKVQTRNGFWFNVDSANVYFQEGMVSLKLGQIASICKDRHRVYTNDGRTQQSAEVGETYFDPYDLINIEIM